MSNSIPLSPKHGLNPSMTYCLYCNQETGIALMGKLKGDAEAPRRVADSPMPCEKCVERLKAEQRTMLIATKNGCESNPIENLLGKWIETDASNLNIPYTPIAFIDEDLYNHLAKQIDADKKE